MTVAWFPDPVFIHRHQENKDFAYVWQAVGRGRKELENIALIETHEYLDLLVVYWMRLMAKPAIW